MQVRSLPADKGMKIMEILRKFVNCAPAELLDGKMSTRVSFSNVFAIISMGDSHNGTADLCGKISKTAWYRDQ